VFLSIVEDVSEWWKVSISRSLNGNGFDTRRRLFPQPEEVLGHLDRRDPFSPSCATNHRGLLQLRDDNADESEGGV
jgi:hypothetical protein